MSIEIALMEKDSMITLYEKKLFITLFGALIDESYRKRVNENESVDIIFEELCVELVKKSS